MRVTPAVSSFPIVALCALTALEARPCALASSRPGSAAEAGHRAARGGFHAASRPTLLGRGDHQRRRCPLAWNWSSSQASAGQASGAWGVRTARCRGLHQDLRTQQERPCGLKLHGLPLSYINNYAKRVILRWVRLSCCQAAFLAFAGGGFALRGGHGPVTSPSARQEIRGRRGPHGKIHPCRAPGRMCPQFRSRSRQFCDQPRAWQVVELVVCGLRSTAMPQDREPRSPPIPARFAAVRACLLGVSEILRSPLRRCRDAKS